MYYSYYYDIEKTHLINFGFNALVINEDNATSDVTAQFNVYIREIKDGVILKEEKQNSQFVFDGKKRNKEKNPEYDLDFMRERIGKNEKFIFKVSNNFDSTQTVTIGLFTKTALTNPLGCEIIYEEELYKAEIKGIGLSQLESTYVEPVVKQTILNYNFNDAGIPEELELLDGGEYVNGYKLLRTPRMAATFKEAIKGNNRFVFEVNIAPETIDISVEPTIFEVILNGVGTFSLNKTTMDYIPDGRTAEERVTVQLPEEIRVETLFDLGLRPSSLLHVVCDGMGKIEINYANAKITSIYEPTKEFKAISIEGKIREGMSERIKLKLDNIVAYYEN